MRKVRRYKRRKDGIRQRYWYGRKKRRTESTFDIRKSPMAKIIAPTGDTKQNLENAIVHLYGFQTETEQKIKGTNIWNKQGFNKFDAPFLSSLAQQIISGRPLSFEQALVAKQRMFKYRGQLRRTGFNLTYW